MSGAGPALQEEGTAHAIRLLKHGAQGYSGWHGAAKKNWRARAAGALTFKKTFTLFHQRISLNCNFFKMM